MDDAPSDKSKEPKRQDTALLSKDQPAAKDNSKDVKPAGRSRARSIWGRKKEK